mmetsp:Transcript_74173/g.209496  ORF Transcript_74173/g.209496 Transcript_74173/m.209496 type:complete len:305 (+) Transcript_74173:392-1306(+)
MRAATSTTCSSVMTIPMLTSPSKAESVTMSGTGSQSSTSATSPRPWRKAVTRADAGRAPPSADRRSATVAPGGSSTWKTLLTDFPTGVPSHVTCTGVWLPPGSRLQPLLAARPSGSCSQSSLVRVPMRASGATSSPPPEPGLSRSTWKAAARPAPTCLASSAMNSPPRAPAGQATSKSPTCVWATTSILMRGRFGNLAASAAPRTKCSLLSLPPVRSGQNAMYWLKTLPRSATSRSMASFRGNSQSANAWDVLPPCCKCRQKPASSRKSAKLSFPPWLRTLLQKARSSPMFWFGYGHVKATPRR